MKKLSVLIVMVLFTVGGLLAQRTISGTIEDSSGDLLIGASVVAQGTTVGTVTDIDGTYSLNVPDGTTTLVFSYIGYENQEIALGASNVIDVTLSQGVILREVVVTALGIEKKKDRDISSSTAVTMDGFEKAGESGLVQGLSGKTSGVNITSTSGDPGAGAYIQIRGQNTILGDHNPIIILDGVMISNTSAGSSTQGVVQQSRLNDINPEDIASITVLKGASAAAIYGSKAANGVLVVTTKKGVGTADKKWKIDVKSSIHSDQVNIEWEKQDIYGQGFPGHWVGGDFNPEEGIFWETSLSYGSKIANRAGGEDEVDTASDRYFVSESGKTYYPIIKKNSTEVFNQSNRDAVFDSGLTFENSVALNYADDNSRTYLSFSNWDQDGMYTAGADYKRNTMKLNNTTKLSDKLSVSLNTSYTRSNSNRVQTGSNLNGLYLGYLRTSPDFDNRDYLGTAWSGGEATPNSHRGYRKHMGSVRTFDDVNGVFTYSAPTYNNPLWTLNKQKNINVVDRFIVAPEVSYFLTDKIQVIGRYSVDFYKDRRQNYWPAGSAAGSANGVFGEDNITESVQNYNLFVSGSTDVSDDIIFDWLAGYQYLTNDYDRFSGTEKNFTNPEEGYINFGNAVSGNSNLSSDVFTTGKYIENKRTAGAYTVLNFSLYDQFLVELSGRGERVSTIPNRGIIFYPAISTGWIFSKNLTNTNILSFGKLRAAYGEVGVEPVPYSTSTSYTSGNITSGWGDGFVGANYGNPIARSSLRGNPDIREERVKEIEFGVDTRFLSNRLGFSFTYYDRKTEDALLQLPTAPSSGYSDEYRNAATIKNKGFEIDINGDVIKNRNLVWNLYANLSKNTSSVHDLQGTEYFTLNGFTSTSSGVAEGQPFGVLRGGVYERDDSGNLVLNENGFPIAGGDDFVGDPNPDWIGAGGTSLSWKGLTLSLLVQTSQGGDVWNGTKGVLTFFGIHTETAVESVASTDLVNAAGESIPAGTVFRGYEKDFGAGPVAIDHEWWTTNGGGFGDVSEIFIEDASWTRLREVSLFYNLPNNVLKSIGFQNVSFGITGRNLLIWTNIEGFDPESNLTGASKGRGLEYFSNPGSKSIIGTLKFSF